MDTLVHLIVWIAGVLGALIGMGLGLPKGIWGAIAGFILG
jgi:hypothetical protein